MKKTLETILAWIIAVVGGVLAVLFFGKQSVKEGRTEDNKEAIKKIEDSPKNAEDKKEELLKKYAKKVLILVFMMAFSLNASYVKLIDGTKYDFSTITNYVMYLEDYSLYQEHVIKSNGMLATSIRTNIIQINKVDTKKLLYVGGGSGLLGLFIGFVCGFLVAK